MSDDRILVVDDDPDVRSTVADALEEEGYDVATASNGAEALRMLLAGSRPSVILLDLMMPEMDGWTFRAEQRKHPDLAAIPVVIFTAYGVPDDMARHLDAYSLLRKPVELDELLRAIDRAWPPR